MHIFDFETVRLTPKESRLTNRAGELSVRDVNIFGLLREIDARKRFIEQRAAHPDGKMDDARAAHLMGEARADYETAAGMASQLLSLPASIEIFPTPEDAPKAPPSKFLD